MGLYDLDFHAWALEQAELLKRRSANEIDWDNIEGEIRSLGGQLEWELYNRFVVLLSHLLKWRFQPSRRGRSWMSTIAIQRHELARHIRKNPSLKAVQDREFAEAYVSARIQAAGETDLDDAVFPADSPFTLAQALDPDWLPEPESDQSSPTASNGS